MTGELITKNVWRFPLPSLTLPPFEHTNSYLIRTGKKSVLVDCGSDDPAVLDALEHSLGSLGVTRPSALLLTHTHPDHRAGAAALQERFGVTVYAHPLEAEPSEPLEDGEVIQGIRAYHTPGHSPGHLSFEVPGVLLVGDLLAAEGSTWVGLPGGDVTAYLASLARVRRLVVDQGVRVLGPGHGPVVTEPLARLEAVRSHRLARETQVLATLTKPLTLTELRDAVYPGLLAEAENAADGSLLALLDKLIREGRVISHDRHREDGEHSVTETTWTLP